MGALRLLVGDEDWFAVVATNHCYQQGGTTVGFEGPGTGNTDGPQPSWWKVSIGIVFLVALISFGTLRNISQDKPKMFVSIVEPVFALFGAPLPVDLRQTLEHWKDAAEEIEFHDLMQNSDQHKGKYVYFLGTVHSVEGSSDKLDMIVKVAPSDRGIQDGHVCLKYTDAPINIVEGDVVEFVAEMQGVWEKVRMPEMSVRALEIRTQ